MSAPYSDVRAADQGLSVSTRAADYLEMTKPRISLMVLITVSVGFALGSFGVWQLPLLLHAMAGIALVATASSALNQVLERETDGLMARTASRPLPAGRLSALEVTMFGLTCAVLGTLWLAVFVNVLTAALTLLTLSLYVLAYTPLKSRSHLCTAIGAIPGALPPVLGWTAAGAELDSRAMALFAILFLWQFPHFLAIAFLHRADYARAGLKMLPGNGVSRIAGTQAVCYAMLLLPVSLLPGAVGLAGVGYSAAAVILGVGYLVASVRFLYSESPATARGVLFTSLVYLPVLLLSLMWDHFSLLQ